MSTMLAENVGSQHSHHAFAQSCRKNKCQPYKAREREDKLSKRPCAATLPWILQILMHEETTTPSEALQRALAALVTPHRLNPQHYIRADSADFRVHFPQLIYCCKEPNLRRE